MKKIQYIINVIKQVNSQSATFELRFQLYISDKFNLCFSLRMMTKRLLKKEREKIEMKKIQ